MSKAETEQAIAWYEERIKSTPMPGARKMYEAALEALRAQLNAPVRCGECILRGTVGCAMDGIHLKTNKDHDCCSHGKRRSDK